MSLFYHPWWLSLQPPPPLSGGALLYQHSLSLQQSLSPCLSVKRQHLVWATQHCPLPLLRRPPQAHPAKLSTCCRPWRPLCPCLWTWTFLSLSCLGAALFSPHLVPADGLWAFCLAHHSAPTPLQAHPCLCLWTLAWTCPFLCHPLAHRLLKFHWPQLHRLSSPCPCLLTLTWTCLCLPWLPSHSLFSPPLRQHLDPRRALPLMKEVVPQPEASQVPAEQDHKHASTLASNQAQTHSKP
mmetsp:Transcript_9069/g.20154  ORF Transcript_9069/g.20154 Transcript_9069/m.20154 type:complete len:239 (-) Transcript_9069:12-728(-)